MKKDFHICFCLALIAGFLFVADIEAAEFGKTNPAKVFREQGFGYSIEYPSEWVYIIQSGKTIVFSGASGTKAYYSTVSMQNLLSMQSSGGKYKDIDSVVDDLKAQLKTAKEVRLSGVESVYYRKNNADIVGKQFIAEYVLDGDRFKQWIVVMPRPKGDMFHTWFYTSPIDQYNEFFYIAKAMLDSWIIIEQ